MNLKVGDYIKIKLDRKGSSWYHDKIMKIIKVEELLNEQVYTVKGKWKNFSNDNEISRSNSYQDHECKIRSIRKDKLKRILK